MGNEAMKEKFIAVLRDMNIPGLPAALPNQYPELYRRFKAIIDEAQP
jgi:hypothetical protein